MDTLTPDFYHRIKKYKVTAAFFLLSIILFFYYLSINMNTFYSGYMISDLIIPSFFNLIVILIFISIGILFDKKWYKLATLCLSLVIAIIPFFTDVATISSLDFSPYALPFYIGGLFPNSLQGGHPPPIIFLAPIIWLFIGILSIVEISFIYDRKKRNSQ